MPWYVFALVDARPEQRAGKGLRGPLAVRQVAGGYAVVERRADVPPLEFDTLRRHDAVVSRMADAVPAILPVRFGTLLELEEIEDALAEREEEVAEAFAKVRGRVQFTWRERDRPGARRQPRKEKPEVRTAASGVRDSGGAAPARGAGSAYLLRAARAAMTVPPPAFRTIRDKLRPFVDAERYQQASATLPDSLYHLVDRARVTRYESLARALGSRTQAVRYSGPFPPFAFTPELL